MLIARRVARRGFSAAAWGILAGVLLYLFDVKQCISAFKHRARLRTWRKRG